MMVIELLEATFSIITGKPKSYIILLHSPMFSCYVEEEFNSVLGALLKIYQMASQVPFDYAQIPTKKNYDARAGVIRWRLITKFRLFENQLTVQYTVDPKDTN